MLVISIVLDTLWIVQATSAERPALVVLVSVDQWPYEYLERFRAGLAADGLVRRCAARGVVFTNCHHEHAFTFTAPGHAVLATGAHPSLHGIVGNDLYDRKLNRTVYAVADPAAVLIGKILPNERLVSPRSLLCETLGDRLNIATHGKAKVFAVGIKDRASILLAGRGADAAFWMSNAGEWITSESYRSDVPGYLRQLNPSIPHYEGRRWELLLSPERYQHGVVEDNLGEKPLFGVTPGFPHVLPSSSDPNFIKQLAGTIFGNEATLAAAREVLVHEQLGRDDVPDLLAINLSSNDYIGHAFGPQSLEVEDATYRTDLALGQFVDTVNRHVGERPWLMVATSDHGVCPIPELLEKRFKIPAKREPLGPVDKETENWTELAAALELHLRASLRIAVDPTLVQAVTEYQVFLRREHPALQGEQWELAQRTARDWLLMNPFIAAAATREQLLSGQATTKLDRAFHHSFHPERSGEVLFVLKPYHFQGAKDAAATHGSPWRYDTHVPLMLLPQNRKSKTIRPQRIDREIGTTSIASTLAVLMGVDPPSMCFAEPLRELVELWDEVGDPPRPAGK